MKLSELNPSEQRKIFVYGESGTGKTVYACGFPTPLYVFDFDGKVNSAAAFYAKTEQLAGIEYDKYVKLPGNPNDFPYVRFMKKLEDLERAAAEGKFPYGTVVLDSATLWAESMLTEVIRTNPGIPRPRTQLAQTTSMQDYGIFAQHFHMMLVRVRELPAHVVLTGHIQAEKDDLTGAITYDPLLPGKRASKLIPILFEEVYRSYTEIKDNKVTYMAQTQALPQYRARTQISGLPPNVKLSYAEFAKYFTTKETAKS